MSVWLILGAIALTAGTLLLVYRKGKSSGSNESTVERLENENEIMRRARSVRERAKQLYRSKRR